MNLLYVYAGVGIVLLTFILLIIMTSFRVVVPTNEVHIVQSAKHTVSYGKGNDAGNSYYRWPTWVPVVGVRVIDLPMSVFDIRLDNYHAYDKDRVPFEIDILAFFRVVDSNVAAQRVSSIKELDDQLMGILKGVCRTILAGSELQDILQGRAQFGKLFTDEVDGNLKQWGIQSVKQIEMMDIRDIDDSKAIANIMAKKKSHIEMDSRITVAGNIRDAQLAEVNAVRQVEIQKRENDEAIGIRTAAKDKAVGVATQEQLQAIREAERATAEKEMSIVHVRTVKQAEITRDAQVVAADQTRQTNIIAAEAGKQVAITAAEGTKTQTVLNAEGALSAAKLNAEGVAVQGKARGEAETAVLMAPVTTQITLAKEIGENTGYQTYLVSLRTIDKDQAVGIANADAISHADIKIIANTGGVQPGIKSVLDLLSASGGTQLGAMIEAFKQTPAGAALLADKK